MQVKMFNRSTLFSRARITTGLLLSCLCVVVAACGAEEKPAEPVSVKYRITGMFSPERQDDLREAAAKVTDVKLSAVDYANSEATFTYDPAKMSKGAKPDQIQTQIESKLKEASNHTFGLSAPIANRDKLTRVEIHVGILDCKACAYGVYLAVTGVAGVEQATVGMKDGLVIAWIDSEKTNRAALTALLKTREIPVKDAEPAPAKTTAPK